MAEYNKHSMYYTYNGINHYEINRRSAYTNKTELITIDNISFDGDEYEVEITLSNLSDDMKDRLRSQNGRFSIEIGRMRVGSDYLAGYRRPHAPGGHRKVSMRSAPNHHFMDTNSFTYTIPNNELDQPHTYVLYLSEYDLVGMDRGEEDIVRYKNRSIAESWQYIILRTRFRIYLWRPGDSTSSPYFLNSEEIVTYNNYY